MSLDLYSKNNHIFLREFDLHEISREYGSPLFLYDHDHIRKKINSIAENLAANIKIYYSVKANPNTELLKSLTSLIDGVDVSSAGELRQVLAAGYSSEQISFAGPGKTDEELAAAISGDIGSISVESINELKRIEKIAEFCGKKANVSLRINPAKVHKKFAIKMGGKSTPFGIDEEKYPEFFEQFSKLSHCEFMGIHVFSGTQCLDEETLIDNISYILELAGKIIERTQVKMKKINFGGGFGIPYYTDQKEISIDHVCFRITELFNEFQQRTGLDSAEGILELGRYLVGDAGIYIAQVVDIKESREKRYCVLNGGMNHHLAASGNLGQFFRKNNKIINISNSDDTRKEQYTIVGPLCTSLDILGEQVEITKPEVGHYIAILNSGAYVYTASPLLFLSRATPIELLILENKIEEIRSSLKIEDLW